MHRETLHDIPCREVVTNIVVTGKYSRLRLLIDTYTTSWFIMNEPVVEFRFPGLPLYSGYYAHVSIEFDRPVAIQINYRELHGKEIYILTHYKFSLDISPLNSIVDVEASDNKWIFVNGFIIPYEPFKNSPEARFSRPLTDLLDIIPKG